MHNNTIFYIMGVSGCGKSTVGKLLATALNLPFFDGDDYHSKANVEKMSLGRPLDDTDRKEWLASLNALASKHKERGAVIACSALKDAYRQVLQKNIDNQTRFVFLKGNSKEILERIQSRKNHFMPPELLKSQFETLEIPSEAITVSIQLSPKEIVSKITAAL